MKTKEYSGHVLAYIGDAVLSLMVREYLVELGLSKSKELQEKSVQFVSAKAQAQFVERLLNESYFEVEELEIYKRGRNHKSNTIPKNTEVVTYRKATGLEALFGYWHLEKKREKIEKTFAYMIACTKLK